jgi:predicted DNA-binding transcriptional regulator YafY
MPRNEQAVRQLVILNKLEHARHGLTLDQLAEGLDPSAVRHPRTLRRDLDAIESAGYPLLTERSDGRTRWKLLDGVRHAPALRFSPTELMALTLSRRLIAPLEGTAVHASLQSALGKASAVLPPEGLALVQQLEDTFAVGLGPHKRYKRHREIVERVTQAIADKTRIQMRYDSASRGRVTRREVDPYRLWYASGGLYLIGYCHLRKEPRMFAVERIKSVTPTELPYQIPLHFDFEAFVEDSLTVMRGPRIEVELLFEKATAAWAKDRIWHPSQQLKRLPGGKMRLIMTVADSRELVGWILSFGSGVHVVRPESLRAAVREEATKILRLMTSSVRNVGGGEISCGNQSG